MGWSDMDLSLADLGWTETGWAVVGLDDYETTGLDEKD
jgi:hypothetical protein